MSQILTPGERPTQWGTAGDHERRLRALEAVDPCACFDIVPDSFADALLANPCLVALWKLDDFSGDIAVDSGPSGLDQDSGTYSPPTWQQEDSPAGDPSAFFNDGLGLSRAGVTAMSGDFSSLILFNRSDLNHGELFGQGDPESANTPGWNLAVGANNEGAFNRPKVFIGDNTGGPHGFEADDPILTGDWTMVGTSRVSNVWRLYVDGVQQSGSYDDGGTNFDNTTGVWTGNNPADVGQTTNFHGLLAYAALFSCGLAADDWEGLQEILDGTTGVQNGWVWTVVDGTPEWAPPTIEVEF